MTQISLLAWTKQHGVTYSTAQKWVREGIVVAEKVKGRVLIEESVQPPASQKIQCQLCQREFPQITGTHLRSHGLSLAQYQEQFPDAPIISEEVREKNRSALLGIERSDEFKQNVSEGRKGIRPENHPRYVKGAYSPSEETRAKMSAARQGYRHTEEIKQKIGDAHRGVPETPEAVENNKHAQQEYWAEHDSPKLGVPLSDEQKEKQSKAMLAHEETLDPEFKERRRQWLLKAALGAKRTPEQRERYRQARLRYMEEHPEEWQRFSETKLEIEFKAWCDELGIRCEPQCFITYEGQKHPFDFYLPEYSFLVECDGPHHWELPWFATDDPERFLQEQRQKDQYWTSAGTALGYRVVRLRGRNRIGDEGSGSIDEQIMRVFNDE